MRPTSPGLLQQRGGPLCNCVHTAWTGNGPLWPPPGKALAQTMHKTRPVPFFSHTGPPIFSLRDVASARLVHHQLSWESASCCVGVHGRHLSPRCTPSSEVQDIPMRLLTPPVKHLSNFNLPDMSLWNTTAKNTSLSSTALKPPYQQLVPILTI